MIEMPLLSYTFLIPLLGGLLLLLWPSAQAARRLGLLSTGLQIGVLLMLFMHFNPEAKGLQFTEQKEWMHFSLGNLGQFVVHYALGLDGLSLVLAALTGLIFFLAIWHSGHIVRSEKSYYALMLLMNAAIMGCFFARDLLLFYVCFEFMLLPMYFLIGLWGGAGRNYASIKFLIYTLIGSLLILVVMLMMGISYIDPYETGKAMGLLTGDGSFGLESLHLVQQALANGQIPKNTLVHSFDIQALSDAKNCQTQQLLHPQSGWELGGISARAWGFWLLFFGFAIKVPVVPFHTWLPDAHVEASTGVSVVLAAVLLKLGAYGWMRFCLPFFPQEAIAAAEPMAILASICIIYGAYNALAMQDLKKLVAYSSISHMGFVLLGISAFNAQGWQGAIFQMVSHGILSAALFLLVGVLYDRYQDRSIPHFSGLNQGMPWFSLAAGLSFFASLGMPGFSGFIGEFFSLLGAFQSGLYPMQWPIIASFGLLLGAGYFLWTFQKMFWGKPYLFGADWKMNDLNTQEALGLFSLCLISILLGILPNTLFQWTEGFVGQILAYIK